MSTIQDLKKRFFTLTLGFTGPSLQDLEKEYYSKAIEGDLPSGTVSWDDVEDKPEVIASGSTEEAARDSIGAGTSNLVIGTTSSTAKAGDYQPTIADVEGLQAILNDFENRIADLENPEI